MVCNAAGLDRATGLGVSQFQGIAYPANANMSYVLYESFSVDKFTERLATMVPKADNVTRLEIAAAYVDNVRLCSFTREMES